MTKYEYRPIPPAVRFHESNAEFRLLVCGARSGKTRAVLGGEAIRDAFWQPGYYQRDIDSGDPYNIVIAEPTFKMVDLIAWRLVKKGIYCKISAYETKKIITCRGVHGFTQIIFVSYEQGPEKMEGIAVYRAYLDEVFQCPKPFFDEVVVRLSDRMGRFVGVGTPKPVAWIQEELIDKADGELIFFDTWKTKDNPYFPKKRLEMLKKVLPPKIFRRNYEASLECFDGQIYEAFDKRIHVQDWEINPADYKLFWGSHDWGYSHNGANYIFGLRDDDEVDILHEVSEPRLLVVPTSDEVNSWARVMLDRQAQYEDKFDVFHAGPDRPENIRALADLGVRIRAADDSVNEGVEFVSALMHVDGNNRSKLRIHAKNCPILAKRIPMYRWKETTDGSLSETPLKKDDDEVDSMRYGLFSKRGEFRIWEYMRGGNNAIN